MTEKIDKKQLEKKAKRLYALWWVLAALFSTGVSIYMAYQEAINGIDINAFPSVFHVVVCGVLGLVFMPLLVLVRKWSKEAEAAKLYTKATKMFWAFAIATAGTLFMNVISCFLPDLFS